MVLLVVVGPAAQAVVSQEEEPEAAQGEVFPQAFLEVVAVEVDSAAGVAASEEATAAVVALVDEVVDEVVSVVHKLLLSISRIPPKLSFRQHSICVISTKLFRRGY